MEWGNGQEHETCYWFMLGQFHQRVAPYEESFEGYAVSKSLSKGWGIRV